jgi:hypothetical protein
MYVRAFKEWQIMGSVCDKRRQTKRNMVTEEEIQRMVDHEEEIQDIEAQLEISSCKS